MTDSDADAEQKPFSHLTPTQREAVEVAAQAQERLAFALSGPQSPTHPLFAWSIQPMTGPQIKARVEAEGNNPFEVLAGWPLPPEMVGQVPGRPLNMPYCWLVIVKIRANPVSWDGTG